MKQHTLNVVLGIGFTRLVVVHQGDDVEQVVLAQLLQAICELLHVDVLVPPVLLLGRVLVTHAVRVGGARLLEKGEQLGLGVSERLQMAH
jgi:hypothetical protein